MRGAPNTSLFWSAFALGLVAVSILFPPSSRPAGLSPAPPRPGETVH